MAHDTYAKLIELLDRHGATYRLIDHPPEGKTEIVSKMRGNELSQAANCIVLMVKVGKKTTKYVLAVYPADKKLDLEAVKALFDGTYISFASPDIAEKLAGSELGTVLPFSFHDDLELLVDSSLPKTDEIFFNAARLDRSMALETGDYLKITQPRLESIVKEPQSTVLAKKQSDHGDHLYNIRHSLAHVLAQAVLKLHPDVQIAIGPPIDTGCYYDFFFQEPLSEEEIPAIEKEMRKIINQGQTFAVETLSVNDAVAFWKLRNQPFKVELIEDLKKDGATEVTHHRNLDAKGKETFVDLCKGGHVENVKEIPADAFKILSLAGAYWRGDEKNAQLTRIYVAAFASKEELQAYLTMMEEAKKRDHRKLGKELDLFTFSDLVGAGLPLWTPRGTLVRNLLDGFVWELREARGYQRVSIPHITKKELYETSGHWEKFSNDLFRITTREGHEFAMKPMNCPHHTQIYASKARSYKDLPQRYAETTTCYRDEQTGELHGLSRVRSFAQDDAHVFCRMQQVNEEFLKIWDIIDTFYPTVGFGDLSVRLSLHDPKEPGKYLGTPERWADAESRIREIATSRGKQFTEAPGEAAFYGPKVDFITKDSLGREWQVATIQLDINMPDRFDLWCTNEKGERERIVMIHAAIMGSIERFLSMYLEHVVGHFPLWLAPVQVAILPVAGTHEAEAKKIVSALAKQGMRVELLDASESLGKRIREGERLKIPYLAVLGDKEVESGSLALRNVQTKEQKTVPLAEFIEATKRDIAERRLHASF